MSNWKGLVFVGLIGAAIIYFSLRNKNGYMTLNVKVYWTDGSWSVITQSAFDNIPDRSMIHHYESTTLALGDHGSW